MGIFDRRTAFKPFEYPAVTGYKDAINHSFWLVSEWNFTSDVHDFHTKLNNREKSAIKNTLLAISQIEVSVKKFWAELGKRFPKAEFEQVGITFGECFIDGTEILTPTGWIDLKDISKGDKVLQYNTDNTLSVTNVKAKIDQFYSGSMLRFSKSNTDSIVTPTHRMLVYKQGGPIEFQANKLSMSNTNLKLPESALLRDNTINALSFKDRLSIAIQADGNRRYYNSGYGRKLRKSNGIGSEYEVRILKTRKIERMDWILSNISDIKYTKLPIPSRPGMYCYTIKLDSETDYKNFNWVDLSDKSGKWAQEFVEELSYWDGSRLSNKKDCKIKFSSTNKLVADMAQAVGVAAGYKTNMITRVDNRSNTFNDCYIVSFTSNRQRVTLPPLKREEFQYDGMVRCVTVESGWIVTRYKNKTFISGNSEVRHADAYSHLLEVLGLNDDFTMLLQNPVIQGRVDYLTKYLKGAADTSDQNYTLTLTLFSLFVENVSLFSQFAIIKAFNKYKNLLKDVDNVVQATAKEEQIHALLGAYLVNQIKDEHPDWFDEDFYLKIERATKKAFDAESKIIDWIFEAGELDFISTNTLKEFIKDRFNKSLELIGAKALFPVDLEVMRELKWFDEEIHAETVVDFFHKKSTAYSKNIQSFTEGDLF